MKKIGLLGILFSSSFILLAQDSDDAIKACVKNQINNAGTPAKISDAVLEFFTGKSLLETNANTRCTQEHDEAVIDNKEEEFIEKYIPTPAPMSPRGGAKRND